MPRRPKTFKDMFTLYFGGLYLHPSRATRHRLGSRYWDKISNALKEKILSEERHFLALGPTLLKEELMKRDTLLSKIKQDPAWTGGTITITIPYPPRKP